MQVRKRQETRNAWLDFFDCGRVLGFIIRKSRCRNEKQKAQCILDQDSSVSDVTFCPQSLYWSTLDTGVLTALAEKKEDKKKDDAKCGCCGKTACGCCGSLADASIHNDGEKQSLPQAPEALERQGGTPARNYHNMGQYGMAFSQAENRRVASSSSAYSFLRAGILLGEANRSNLPPGRPPERETQEPLRGRGYQ